MSLFFLNNRVARLQGRLYSGNLSEIQFKIESALDRTPILIIDLNPLEKLDAAGVFMLYMTIKKARENNKEIMLACSKNEIVKLFFSIVGIQFFHYIPQLKQ